MRPSDRTAEMGLTDRERHAPGRGLLASHEIGLNGATPSLCSGGSEDATVLPPPAGAELVRPERPASGGEDWRPSLIRFFTIAIPLLTAFAFPEIADALELPEDQIIMHRVEFSDPAVDDPLGGHAYDRNPGAPTTVSQPELAANKAGTNSLSFNSSRVQVFPAKAAPRVTFTNSNTNVASFTQPLFNGGAGELVVTGNNVGTALVRTPTYLPASLGVSVFTPFQTTIDVHIIGDTAGHVPNITQAQATAFFNEANEIWKSQANISFGPNPIIRAPIQINANFGEYVDYVDIPANHPELTHETPIIRDAEFNDGVEINVFIVYDFARNGIPKDGLTIRDDETGKPIIFVAHNEATMMTLAHELGHALGLLEEEGTADYRDDARHYQLMWYGRGSGRTIVPSQGRQIHGIDF